jgi:putative ABC transport system permease protein
MGQLRADLRFALRLLWRSPAFTLAAVGSLALGIGANTAIFTLVNAVFLDPIDVREPQGLVSVFTTDERNRGQFFNFMPTSFPNARDYRELRDVFEGLAVHQGVPLNLASGGEPEQVPGEIVSNNYFSVLGVSPLLGRAFDPTDRDDAAGDAVVVLSYGLWQNRFAADPAIVGKEIVVNNQSFTVIGVMPHGFRGVTAIAGPLLWVPMSARDRVLTGFFQENFEERRALLFFMTGRLRPGVTVDEAAARLQTTGRQLAQAYPVPNKGRSATALPLLEATINPGLRGQALRGVTVLSVVVGLVLLIACANVANLLLARAATRRREIAVRLSLGASRARLVRQLLTESLLLALVAGAAGLVVAHWSRQALLAMRPPFFPANVELPLSTPVLLFTLSLSLLTGVVFGLAPALHVSRADLNTELRDRASSMLAGRYGAWLRAGLVAAQVALSLITLAAAGLFLRSLGNAQRIDPGFDADRLAVVGFDLGAQNYTPERARQFHRELLDRMRSLPSVGSAALAGHVPFIGGAPGRTIFPEGVDATNPANGVFAFASSITPGYFETTGIDLVAGRSFAETDAATSPHVVVVNEAMAHRFWPRENAVGKRFRFFGDDAPREVVGVARNAKMNFIGEEALPLAYVPLEQVHVPAVFLHVRAERPGAVLPDVRAVMRRMDNRLPLTNVNTMDVVTSQALWAPRMAAWLLGAFAVLALVLAALGLYGVLAYAVSQRTAEFGVRMALGADAPALMRLVLGQGFLVAGIGAAIGLAGAVLIGYAGTAVLRDVLYNVPAVDPVTLISVIVVLGAVTLLACYLPARRATRVDPVVALRTE